MFPDAPDARPPMTSVIAGEPVIQMLSGSTRGGPGARPPAGTGRAASRRRTRTTTPGRKVQRRQREERSGEMQRQADLEKERLRAELLAKQIASPARGLITPARLDPKDAVTVIRPYACNDSEPLAAP